MSQAILLTTCSIISYEMATGYVVKTWDDRMLILVSISSVLTMVGQAWSKSAFAVTLLRPGITTGWQRWVLWFIIASLNIYLVITFFLQWTNYCGKTPYWWKVHGVCVPYETIFQIKMGRNSKCLNLDGTISDRERLARSLTFIAVYNIVTDFVLALFPWVVTWNLRIKRLEKIGICFTMSLGVVVAVISTWRTVYMMGPDMNNYDRWYFCEQSLPDRNQWRTLSYKGSNYRASRA